MNPRLKHLIAPADQCAPLQPALVGMDISVTLEDLNHWVDVIAPHISTERRAAYIRGYNVAAKVRAAKMDGSWLTLSGRFTA